MVLLVFGDEIVCRLACVGFSSLTEVKACSWVDRQPKMCNDAAVLGGRVA